MPRLRPHDFRKKLYLWSEDHPRELPWVGEKDPYKIWVSEVILQQTRAAQAIPYYLRFLARFPDLISLASAPLEDLLRVWEGLGYYSRARNMHRTARLISENLGGAFPDTFDRLSKLPGIGPYTAAAISSFAFGCPHAVVDGNVNRVLSRIFGIDSPVDRPVGKKLIAQIASDLLDRKAPDRFNQAIMNFGATHCLHSSPLCPSCPFRSDCIAYALGKTSSFPVKSLKKPVKDRFLHYFLVLDEDGNLPIRQRDDGGIWKHLFEPPGTETEDDRELAFKEIQTLLNSGRIRGTGFKFVEQQLLSHRLTHLQLRIRFYLILCSGKLSLLNNPGHILVNMKNLRNFAFPKIIRLYLDQIKETIHAEQSDADRKSGKRP